MDSNENWEPIRILYYCSVHTSHTEHSEQDLIYKSLTYEDISQNINIGDTQQNLGTSGEGTRHVALELKYAKYSLGKQCVHSVHCPWLNLTHNCHFAVPWIPRCYKLQYSQHSAINNSLESRLFRSIRVEIVDHTVQTMNLYYTIL